MEAKATDGTRAKGGSKNVTTPNSTISTQIDRGYFLKKRSHELTQHIVAIGDLEVLETFLDPPYRDDLLLKERELSKHQERLTILSESLAIRRLQARIISNHYQQYPFHYSLISPEEPNARLGKNFSSKLQSELDYRVFRVIFKFQIEHLKFLVKSQELNVEGKIVKVDTHLRIKLHKEFTEQLKDLSKETSIRFSKLTQQQACTLYDTLQKTSIPRIEDEIKALKIQVAALTNELDNLKSDSDDSLSKEWELSKHQKRLAMLSKSLAIRNLQVRIISNHYQRYASRYSLISPVIPNARLGENFSSRLQSELDYRVFQVIRESQIKHRKFLVASRELAAEGKIVKADLRLRVKLHEEFTNQLRDLSKETYIKFSNLTQQQACTLYDELLKKHIPEIEDEIKALEIKIDALTREIGNLKSKREVLPSKYTNKRYRFRLTLLQTLRQVPTIFEIQHLHDITIKFRISFDFSDSASGNNLFHLAIKEGQFGIALFLYNEGINVFQKNHDKIFAIDMQDKDGNGFLHHLVAIGDYDTVHHLLTKGASLLRNKKDQTIIDIKSTKGTFLQFLCNRININAQPKDKQFLGILMRLITHIFNFSHFLIEDDNRKNIFYYFFTMKSSESKEIIFKTFNETILYRNFSSDFQTDINSKMLQHFNALMEELSSNWFYKVWEGIDEKYITTQLSLLSSLQESLDEVTRTCHYMKLYQLLTDIISHHPKLGQFYQDSIAIVKNLTQLKTPIPPSKNNRTSHPLKMDQQSSHVSNENVSHRTPSSYAKITDPLKVRTETSMQKSSKNSRGTTADEHPKKQVIKKPAAKLREKLTLTDRYQWFISYKEQRLPHNEIKRNCSQLFPLKNRRK